MLSDDKIKKLLELAVRGVGGEMENARRILQRNGVDWRNPPKTLFQKVKSSVGLDPVKEYKVEIKYTGDLLFMQYLLTKMTNGKVPMKLGGYSMIIKATPIEMKNLMNVFSKGRKPYSDAITHVSSTLLEKVWKN